MAADPWNGVVLRRLTPSQHRPFEARVASSQARRLAVCVPASDVAFGERARHVVADRGWDLDGADGLALDHRCPAS